MTSAEATERWYHAIRNNDQRIITREETITARDDAFKTRTAPTRAPICRACHFEPQDELHAKLIRTRNPIKHFHLPLEDVIVWSGLPRDVLETHLQYCMTTQVADGSHTPYATELLQLPTGRTVRVRDVIAIIKSHPEAKEAVSTSMNKKTGRTITTRTIVWGTREWLLHLWFDEGDRSTLLDGQYLRDQKSRDIATALEWLANQLSAT